MAFSTIHSIRMHGSNKASQRTLPSPDCPPFVTRLRAVRNVRRDKVCKSDDWRHLNSGLQQFKPVRELEDLALVICACPQETLERDLHAHCCRKGKSILATPRPMRRALIPAIFVLDMKPSGRERNFLQQTLQKFGVNVQTALMQSHHFYKAMGKFFHFKSRASQSASEFSRRRRQGLERSVHHLALLPGTLKLAR